VLVGLEVGMVEKDAVSKDFTKQVLGYGLTTAEIVYRRPDRHWLLQTGLTFSRSGRDGIK
jgi:Usg-like family